MTFWWLYLFLIFIVHIVNFSYGISFYVASEDKETSRSGSLLVVDHSDQAGCSSSIYASLDSTNTTETPFFRPHLFAEDPPCPAQGNHGFSANRMVVPLMPQDRQSSFQQLRVLRCKLARLCSCCQTQISSSPITQETSELELHWGLDRRARFFDPAAATQERHGQISCSTHESRQKGEQETISTSSTCCRTRMGLAEGASFTSSCPVWWIRQSRASFARACHYVESIRNVLSKVSIKPPDPSQQMQSANSRLKNAREHLQREKEAKQNLHRNWRAFLSEAVKRWEAHSAKFTKEENELQEAINAATTAFQEAKEFFETSLEVLEAHDSKETVQEISDDELLSEATPSVACGRRH